MPRQWRPLANLALGVLCVTACNADPGQTPHSEPSRNLSTESSKSPATTTGQAADHAAEADPLTPTPARRPLDILNHTWLLRAQDGSTLIVLDPEYADRSQFRVYDRNWRPRTPLLEVQVRLTMERGLANGFVGHADRWRRNGSSSYAEWVTIDSEGALRVVPTQPTRDTRPARIRPGDVHFQTPHVGPYAYRPSTEAVIVTQTPAWNTPRHTWFAAAGTICVHRDIARPGAVVHTSVDEGRTWASLDTKVLPANAGPRLQGCAAHGDRVILMTGGERPRWLHTLDRSTATLLSSHPLGGNLNPYEWGALPDGTLVIGTNRRGLMVASDSTNRSLEFRPGPTEAGIGGTNLLGHDIIVAGSGLRTLHVSSDEGRTWQTIDLDMPH